MYNYGIHIQTLIQKNKMMSTAENGAVSVFHWEERDTESITLYRTFGTLPKLYNYQFLYPICINSLYTIHIIIMLFQLWF